MQTYLKNILMSKIWNILFVFGQREGKKTSKFKSMDFFIIFLIDVKIPLNISVLAESTCSKSIHLQNLEHSLDVESGFKDKHFMLIWCVYICLCSIAFHAAKMPCICSFKWNFPIFCCYLWQPKLHVYFQNFCVFT